MIFAISALSRIPPLAMIETSFLIPCERRLCVRACNSGLKRDAHVVAEDTGCCTRAAPEPVDYYGIGTRACDPGRIAAELWTAAIFTKTGFFHSVASLRLCTSCFKSSIL